MGFFDILKPGQKNDTVTDLGDHLLTITDVIAPSAVQIGPRSINIGGVSARVFYAVAYPRYLNDGWLQPVTNLERELDISIFIHPINTADMLKKFQKKVAEVQSQIHMKADKGEVRDPQLEAAYQNLEDLRDKLQQSEERLFDVGLYISIYGEDEAALNKAENDIKGLLDSRLIYIKPGYFQQEPGMKSIVPVAQDELLVHSKFNSSPLSSFFPFTSFDLTSDNGILYGINRHNSSLVLFDRFSLTNYNSVTFATSGAGKSYALKLEILRSLMFGTEVIVLDPEREYEYLAEATGGRFFNISLSSDHHINPFDLPAPQEDENPRDILRSHVVELIGLFRLMLGGLAPEEETIIDLAIHETYALKDITGDTNFANQEPPSCQTLKWC
jgi:conjugal transfer ATP-binding protein TraC